MRLNFGKYQDKIKIKLIADWGRDKVRNRKLHKMLLDVISHVVIIKRQGKFMQLSV